MNLCRPVNAINCCRYINTINNGTVSVEFKEPAEILKNSPNYYFFKIRNLYKLIKFLEETEVCVGGVLLLSCGIKKNIDLL